ncbi:capsular polysaccharide biosynthesis protein [Microbacterium sp. SORGH_AS428]|uniref:hypothetical protein n=1 Tax=Microbacterium sp. SORGH_AS_0428 TaxID=3041788 RepID=UPI0028594862|nr:hypothetical protein [Microbacterium sp. SORGH_AS_0428]MDR6200354.1 capsular polysaccharide biosynthesis protein [Microbacterium sp. SORGH_AS_0428]
MDARLYLLALRRMWGLLLGAALLGAACGLGLAASTPRVYAASADILVGDASRIPTVAELATSSPVLDAASAQLAREGSGADLKNRITAFNVYGTFLVRVSATGGSAEGAANAADAVADAVLRRVADADSPALDTDLELAQSAALPSEPRSPDAQSYLTIATASGLALGALIVVVGEYRRRVVLWDVDLQLAGVRPVMDVTRARGRTAVEGALVDALIDRLDVLAAAGVRSVALVDLGGSIDSENIARNVEQRRASAPGSTRVSIAVCSPAVSSGADAQGVRVATTAALGAAGHDAALLLTRRGSTLKTQLAHALETLDELDVSVRGGALIGRDTKEKR